MNPGILLKVVATPVLIGSASLAGRRFGDAVSGWLIALPLTSAPIILLLSIERGTSFGATAATGVLAGALSQAAFALVYGWTSAGRGAAPSFASATLAFFLVTAVWTLLPLSIGYIALAVVLGLLAAIRLTPASRAERPVRSSPAWDIPLRMAIATVLVIALTAAAPLLGARVTGLLAPFPVFAAIMAVFAHCSSGADASRDVLRGLLYGLFSFAAFYAVASLTLNRLDVGVSLLLATLACLGVQGLTLAILRRALA